MKSIILCVFASISLIFVCSVDSLNFTGWAIFLTLIVGIITGLYDMKNYIFIIAFIPTIINVAYAYVLSKNNILLIKKVFLICSIIWIIYDYFVKAYVGLICNSLEMISYVCYFIKKKN